MLVDTHAHLYWDSYEDDLGEVIKKCKENGVELIINVGVDLESSKKALAQDLSPLVSYSTAGTHPHDVSGFTNTDELEKLILENKEKIIAVGECGLDFFFRNPEDDSEQERATQQNAYKTQVDLARRLNLPLIIHCRDAWSDIFIKELEGTKGLFHNFSGTKEDAKKALDLGFYLSFSCVITYPKNQELRDLIKDIPLDRILTETDCPFLPPQTIRGERNDPSYIKEVIDVIAQTKGISPEETSSQILKNTRKLFNLPDF